MSKQLVRVGIQTS